MWKKISGVILICVGAALIVFSALVSKEVKQGDQKIQRSQNAVHGIRQATKGNDTTRQIGRIITQPIQKKINEGKVEANKYRKLSIWSLIVGIVCASIGLCLLIWGLVTKK